MTSIGTDLVQEVHCQIGEPPRAAIALYAALQHIAHVEIAPDLLEIDRLAFVSERRVAARRRTKQAKSRS
jgi:hypothetical protein